MHTYTGVPPLYEMARLSDFAKSVIDGLRPFLSGESKFVFISGPNHTGKTFLAAALWNAIFGIDTSVPYYTNIFRGYKGFFITPGQMMDRYSAAQRFDSAESIQDVIEWYVGDKDSRVPTCDRVTGEYYRMPPYPMVIDDLGMENSTEFVSSKIEQLIMTRINDKSITIFTSNLSLDELTIKYGDRIPSRLNSVATVITMEKKYVRGRENMSERPIPPTPRLEAILARAEAKAEKVEVESAKEAESEFELKAKEMSMRAAFARAAAGVTTLPPPPAPRDIWSPPPPPPRDIWNPRLLASPAPIRATSEEAIAMRASFTKIQEAQDFDRKMAEVAKELKAKEAKEEKEVKPKPLPKPPMDEEEIAMRMAFMKAIRD